MASFWMCQLSPYHIMSTWCAASPIYGCSTQDALIILKIGIMVSYMKLYSGPGNGERISPSLGLSLSPYVLYLHTSSMFTSLQRMGGQKYVPNTDLIMSGFHLQLLDIAVFVIREPLAIQTLLPRDPTLHAPTKSVLNLLLRAESSLNCLETFICNTWGCG